MQARQLTVWTLLCYPQCTDPVRRAGRSETCMDGLVAASELPYLSARRAGEVATAGPLLLPSSQLGVQ